MASQSIGPNHIRVLPKICAQGYYGLGIFDSTSLDRFKQKAGIIGIHFLELTIATSVAVEGDAPKKGPAFLIDIEIGNYAVFLEAETETARP